MLRTTLPLLLIVTALALAACSRTENDPGPGGVTVGEAKALDAAAEKLEARDKAVKADSGSAPAEDAK